MIQFWKWGSEEGPGAWRTGSYLAWHGYIVFWQLWYMSLAESFGQILSREPGSCNNKSQGFLRQLEISQWVVLAFVQSMEKSCGKPHWDRGFVRSTVVSWSVGVASGIIPNACICKYVNELTKAKFKLYHRWGVIFDRMWENNLPQAFKESFHSIWQVSISFTGW